MSLGSTMKQNPLLWPGIAYPSGTSPFGPLRRYSQTVSVLEGTVLHDGAGRLPTLTMEASEKRATHNSSKHKPHSRKKSHGVPSKECVW
ncbi:hypothetical protein QQF64_010915 [Cirrhinus molitorella]|uniref:Uncharacterized protein n=1 Tax=Cirrhinus molitorella TaxID=172907 RepID=A0ABR3M060_9TELE